MGAPVGRTKLASATPTLKVGDAAPVFTLRSHDGREITLAGLRGRNVVIAFFHFAFTNTWNTEIPALSDLQKRLGADGAQVLGISCDTVYALTDWAEHLGGIEYALCSDYWPHGAVAKAYGVMNDEIGRASRSIFILDAKGIVRYIDVHALREVPDTAEIEEQLAKL